MLYVIVSEGRSAAESEPLVATADREIVRLVTRALRERLGHEDEPAPEPALEAA